MTWRAHVFTPKTGHPVENYKCVDITVQVRRNSDGEVRSSEEWAIWDDGELPGLFLWTNGNYGCDCNRYLVFQRVKGDAEDDCPPCGDSAYSVNLINPVTGETYHREFP